MWLCSATIDIDKIKKKEKRDRQKSDKIKLPHKYKSERKPISHE